MYRTMLFLIRDLGSGVPHGDMKDDVMNEITSVNVEPPSDLGLGKELHHMSCSSTCSPYLLSPEPP